MADHERARHPRVTAVAVALVLCAGLALRVDHLADKLVWHDEIATRIFAAGYTTDDWKQVIYTGRVVPVAEVRAYQNPNPDRTTWQVIDGLARLDPQHPPLYYVLARLWVGLFGMGTGALRSLSVLASLLGLPAAWWLGRELASRRAGWIAALLWSVSPFFVLYAQEAREYALWGTEILVMCAALLRAMRLTEAGARGASVEAGATAAAGGAMGAWALYALSVIVGLYTSFSTVSVMLAHTLFVIARERARPNRVSLSAAASLAVSVLAFVPWGLNLARSFEAFQASMRWSKEIVIPTFDLLRIFALNTSRTVVDLWPDLDSAAAWVVDVGACAAMIAMLFLAARRAPRASVWMLLTLVIAPLLMLLLPDLLWGGIRSVSGRYLTVTWVGLLMASAVGLDSLTRSARVWAVGLFVTAGLVSGVSNARQEVVWTKGVSVGLPEIARQINTSTAPLVVANIEVHHPGNMLALANLLRDDATLQLLPVAVENTYALPESHGDVYLISPNPQFRARVEAQAPVQTRLLYHDLFLELWKVEAREAR
jgi:uncharacterized membrane protein